MPTASTTIPASKKTLWMMLTPKSGRLVRNNGNKAQWMAQANEAVIPRASQFILDLMKGRKYEKATLLQNVEQVFLSCNFAIK